MDYLNCSQHDFESALLNYSNAYYHSNTNSPISDETFDSLVEIYTQRFQKEWNYIGHANQQDRPLPEYMGSLDKCKTESQLSTFLKRCNSTSYIHSDKIDGISVLYVMKGGELTLYTRGNGFKGTDISFLQNYISIPRSTTDVIVRGELVILKETFQKYKDSYENPRAMVSGLINAKEKDYDKIRDIKLFAYYIYDYAKINKRTTCYNMFMTLQKYGFNTPYMTYVPTFIKTPASLLEYLTNYLKINKNTRPYNIDGVVLADNVFRIEKSGENPKFTVAFKITGDTYVSKVVNVEWNLTKHNILKPRIQIEPVIIDGSKIRFLSAFNAKYVLDNNIGTDSIVEITKSGDVIPHIVKTVTSTVAYFPESYLWCENGIDIRPRDNDLNHLLMKRLECLFETCGVKGIKEGIITTIISSGIASEKDFFYLTEQQLLNMDGIQIKSAQKILNAIKQLLNSLTLPRLMSGTCLFPLFGLKRITDITNNIPDISNYILYQKHIDKELTLQRLENLGYKSTASNFIKYLDNFYEYYRLNSFFHDHIMTNMNCQTSKAQFASDTSLVVPEFESIILEGKTCCFSGFRDEIIHQYILDRGGIVGENVTKKTNYLLVKHGSPRTDKVKKAEKYEIQIIEFK